MTCNRISAILGALLLAAASPATANPVHLEAQPGGAVIVDAEDGRMLAVASGGADVSVLDLDADPSRPHHYVLKRPPYLPMDLMLQWEPMVGAWQLSVSHGTPRILRGQTPPLQFSRQFHLNVEPADAVAVARFTQTSEKLLRDPQGMVTLHSAYQPFDLQLSSPGFRDFAVPFHQGELGADGNEFPPVTIRLAPRYGPFTYATFNMCLVLVVVGGAGIVWLSRRRRQRDTSLDSVQAEFAALLSTAASGPRTEFTYLLGGTLQSDHGMGYVLLRLIGQGGMGAVFEAALETDPKSTFAIKIMAHSASGDARLRFERELQSCARLQHPSLVKVIDWGMEGGASQPPFIVFERINGRTLREVYRAEGLPMAQDRAIDIVIDVLKALTSAHQGRVVHRDLKPENIMVLESGRIKVIDFGIAHVAGNTVTASAAAMGTPCYMSPEHFHANKVVPASDVYSMGVILYEMLSGRLPFNAADWYGLMGQILYGQQIPLQDVAEVPPELCSIVARMTDCQVGTRYSACSGAIRDLEDFRRRTRAETEHATP